ncbi:MAG: sigma-70 family RNA polymerase sigma factor [Leptolyngbyaceae bacterium]|nr:sigma-70 family RNA polymerase sigma factor [Leptolyngbyaceae bacterium]
MNSQASSHDRQGDLTDEQLWMAIAQGDTEALGKLYDRHAGLVFSIAIKVLGNAEEAEDLTQDIFIKLTSLSSYDPQRGSLRTYLAILTRSRAVDRIRSAQSAQRAAQRLQGDRLEASSDSPMSDVMQFEQSQEVQAAVAQLPDSQQQILQMAYYEGLTQAKIAERLGTPLGTIKTRARRGLIRLRQLLENQLDSGKDEG